LITNPIKYSKKIKLYYCLLGLDEILSTWKNSGKDQSGKNQPNSWPEISGFSQQECRERGLMLEPPLKK
jgi:hypothetical protein